MTTIEAIGEKVGAGVLLSQADAEALLASADLTAIGMLAEAARVRRHGDRITFVRVAPVALEDPAAWHGPFPSAAGEIRITGNLKDLDSALACVRSVAAATPGVPVSGLVLSELMAWCEQSGTALPNALERLRHAGLELIAEVPLDLMADVGRALSVVAASGLAVARLTVARAGPEGQEALVRRVSALQPPRQIVRSFAPLTRAVSPLHPSTGYDDVKRIALARLLIQDVESIQVDWELHGAKLSQTALLFGADDLDSVPAIDPIDLGPRRASLEEVRRNIRAASLVPAERNARFEIVER
jgi:aminodeoxyfutalosine synthase